MKILIVQTGFFGDLILSLPVLSNLKRLYPEAELTVLCQPAAVSIVEGQSSVQRVIAFDKRGAHSGIKGLLSFARFLKEQKFDLAFALHKSTRTTLLLSLAGIPLRYGFKEASLSFLFSNTVARSEQPHDVLRNLIILQAAGHKLESLDSKLEFTIGLEAEAKAREVLAEFYGADNLVGLAPGSVWETKRWPASHFAALAAKLSASGYQPVFIGGPAERTLIAEIAAASKVKTIDASSSKDFRVSAAVLKRLRVLVTNDSAPLHLASACGVPVAAIFCATVPEFGFGPWGVPSVCLGVDSLSCRPCGRHGGKFCPTETNACREQLSAEQVFNQVLGLLKNTQGSPCCSQGEQ